jgi:ABC-type Zn uptake system ZnuABC Zn-binding protein ZnuA
MPSGARPTLALLLAGSAIGPTSRIPLEVQEKIQVVASLPTYAAIATEIAGDLAQIHSIARGDEDPHFVDARPSFARLLQNADLFISTGLDLELWVPGLLDRANNPKVVEGGAGHVVAYAGVELLDVPANVSRVGGDVHVFGNPHIHTDPINAIIIGRNILAGLRRIDSTNADAYEANTKRFEEGVIRRLFGGRLAELLGVETLFRLGRSNQFWSFAENQEFEGRPLLDYLGGWLAEGRVFRGRQMACYHKNWAYFSARFAISCAVYVERRPGIPPTPGHVQEVIMYLREHSIPVLFTANYFSRRQAEQVAHRGFAEALIVPEHVEGAANVDDYFSLVDVWVSGLARVYSAPRSGD